MNTGRRVVITAGAGAEVTADALSLQAIKRFVDPADIAAFAVFLASDQAKSISGQTVAIDGNSAAAS